MTIFSKSLQQRLSTAEPFMLNIFIVAAVFSTYFCAYGFRKPFTAGSFDLNFTLPLIKVTLSYKILLVVVQTLGYATAKFAGIKLIAEAKKDNLSLVRSIVALLTIAGLSWVLWAITPPPYNLVFIFINGFPLGLIWGLVLSFIEGRKYTELFGTGLSASFIFAAAFSQQIGQAVLNQGISEYWMPLYVSGIYFVPMLIVAWLLGHTPPPNTEDVLLRKERQPMDSTQRKSFMRAYGGGIFFLIIVYMLLNAFRETRSGFAKEIWASIGYQGDLSVFSQSEIIVSILILILLSLLVFVRKNSQAFYITLIGVGVGSALVGLSSFLYAQGAINGFVWMILLGLGTYMGYIPLGSFLFDRLLAATNSVGTVGFLIYMLDAFAYIASISVMLYKNFSFAQVNWLQFMQKFGYLLAIVNVIMLVFAGWIFKQKIDKANPKR
ncbi:DUF5690 family protein [uncultured Microscilla sp.]|uniref:DUF5690 family protein n=1 Tax=uncultured Microscilla sp. TaxID=432653 RepID=UPI00261A5BF3|nr:DUF5690 family protein [uncultured Microscilla sp.]